MSAGLKVIAPGLVTTVQDLGRFGYQRLGIPVSGAMDPVALRAANVLVGNAQEAAALEISYLGPTLRVLASSVRVAFAGAVARLDVLATDGDTIERTAGPLQSLRLTGGQTLRIGPLTGCPVGYLAVEGGLDVAPVLASRSTYLRAAIGGYGGRALAAGDVIGLGTSEAPEREEVMLEALPNVTGERIRVVLGPQDDYFTGEAIETLLSHAYTVTQASDRMGMRLEGPQLKHARGFNIVSDGIAPGAIQVPGNGLPIVLLADRQTTGGYPKIATVISADLPALARLAPGARVRFAGVSLADAVEARRGLYAALTDLGRLLVPAREQAAAVADPARLLRENLISGVVDAHG